MQTRRVLEMGGGTVLISLPKAWARSNNIAKGSSVFVDEISPRRLMVRPVGKEERDVKTATIEYPKENLAYLINDLTGAYLIGSNVIVIRGRQVIGREDRDAIKAAVRRLVGLEIMDEDSKSLTLQFLPEPSTLDPEKIVRRMGSLTQGMLRDVREALKNEDARMLTLIDERDDEVDRLYLLLVRAIRTATLDPEVAETYSLTPVECLDYRVLASFLESLGDTIAEFSRTSAELPELQKIKGVSEAFKILERMDEVAVGMFLGRKSRRNRRAYLEIEAMQQAVEEMAKRETQSRGATPRAAVDLLSLLERITKIFADISDLALPTYEFSTRSD